MEKNDGDNGKLDDGGQEQQVTIPEDANVQHTAEFKGLLNDKQGEVAKRRTAESELAVARGQLAEAQGKLTTADTDQAAEEGAGGGDDLLTRDEVQALMDKQAQKFTEDRQKERDDERSKLFVKSEAQARGTFTAAKMGDGLDFGTVIEQGQNFLTEGDRLAIAQSSEPAAEAYKRCILCSDDLAKRVELAKNSRFLDEQKSKGRGGGVPAGGSGGSILEGMQKSDPTYDRHMAKTDEQLEAEIRELEG